MYYNTYKINNSLKVQYTYDTTADTLPFLVLTMHGTEGLPLVSVHRAPYIQNMLIFVLILRYDC